MRYREITKLTEARQAPLYHLMEYDKAMNVFEHDLMEGRWEHQIPKVGRLKGNSFTRNKRFEFGSRPVRLVVSEAILAQTHRIIPLDAERIFRHTIATDSDPAHEHGALRGTADRIMNRDQQPFSEEFVVGDIRNLHRYLVQVEVHRPMGINGGDAIRLIELVEPYCQRFNIGLVVDPRFTKFVEEIRASWEEDE